MKFAFIAKHRTVWPVAWMCAALSVSRPGFHAWLTPQPSQRIRDDEAILVKARASFVASDRTYGARRVWRDVLAEGVSCGLHRIERIMRENALRARPRRRGLPKDEGERATTSPNLLDRRFAADAPNRKWIADFTYIWTAEGWLYVATVIDLFSRRVVGWSMQASCETSWRRSALGDRSLRVAVRGCAPPCGQECLLMLAIYPQSRCRSHRAGTQGQPVAGAHQGRVHDRAFQLH
ncbi:hypothetical protein MTDSW087_01576 [Methylobacterium dankookense]|uniref:Integrase catalytic domain-containing protein n=1 Tax=Methylobacterium dankookense TaxID=560405 RepID=A0A564FWV5_9HYPH|nr:hypothetical protein IFDJLNFL_5228 [Methylobacterium dankookense]VUF11891.1 hypothetical protein MTDSW087_01576 [Methylobacterium dankookense]